MKNSEKSEQFHCKKKKKNQHIVATIVGGKLGMSCIQGNLI